MTSLVSPSFLKQKARQLKKEKSLSQSEALDEAARQQGFTNYKNYLNTLEANRHKSVPTRESLLKNIFDEKDIHQKEFLAISFIHNFNPPFAELFDIIKQFQSSQEAVQSVCGQSALQNDVQKYLLNYFIESKKDIQALPLKEGFIAKSVSVRSLAYKLDADLLCVSGKYHLEVEFETEVPGDRKHLPHFRRDPMFGEFEATIDKNKNVIIKNPSIGEEFDGRVYMSRFKLL